MDPKLLSHQTESCESIYLKLTDSCNLHCSMCGQAINRKTGLVKEKNFLDFSAIKEFFNPIIEKINYVNLWGGEPCMHPQFLEYVKYFKDNGKYVSIATNGTFLEKYGEAMVKYGVDEIVVSVDGPRSIHNKIRGGHNAFERSEEGIKKVMEFKKHKQIKPKIYINCTVVEDNVKYLQDVLEWSRIINVNKLMFQLPMFFSEAQVQEYEDICIRSWGICAKSPRGFLGNYNIDTEKLFNFYTKVMREHRDIADFYNFRFNNEREMEKYFSEPENNLGRARCVVLDSTLVVEANGDLVMCPDFPDVIYGNIYDKNQECISSEIRENFIAGFKKYSGYPICSRCCQLI